MHLHSPKCEYVENVISRSDLQEIAKAEAGGVKLRSSFGMRVTRPACSLASCC